LGVIDDSCATLCTARSRSALAVNAEIAIGTSWTFCARFCAVTTMSSMPPLLAGAIGPVLPAPGAPPSATCASAG